MSNVDVFSEKVFRERGVKLKLGLIFGFLFFIIASIVHMAVIDFQFDDTSILIWIAIYALIGIGIGVLIAIKTKNRTITVSAKGIVIAKGKKVDEYSLDAIVGTNVTKNYMNGIYIGTSRTLSLLKKDGKIKKVDCSSLGKEQFSEIVSFVDTIRFNKTASSDKFGSDRQETENALSMAPKDDKFFDSDKYYDINRTALLAMNRKYRNLYIFIGILCVVLGFGLGIVFFVIDKDDSIAGIVACGIIGICAGIYFLVPKVISYNTMVKTMPENITISRNYLLINGKTKYEVSDLKKILMTPPTYLNHNKRVMKVYYKGGKAKYSFGLGPDQQGNKDRSYTKYEEIVGNLKYWCLVNDVSFVIDLD